MSSQQLDEERIFHVARELSKPDVRSEYLDQACAADQALRDRVEALLEAHENEQAFLKSDPDAAPTVDHAPLTEHPGSTIGRYKLMEQIGEGGMGTVFVAEQERPIRRKVALKVIKPGMDSKAVVARFEAERQALALMDHPNIAKVLDAGTTDTGRPYFAMELVRGIPITDYCDKNKLTIRERLDLFIQVCQAIQHAHQKGIIHRDIKPSNVLVTLHDGKPVPKVIDFGVAKALNARLTDKTIYTEHLQIVGTLLYMSPEQAELSGLDVDTRSDVYSLGVVLYELLTGTTPFEEGELKEAAFDEQRRLIREVDPPRASNRISSLGETATTVAEHRRTDPNRLHQLVRGELDWIVLRSLEKDRTRRFPTASSFAEDIERYLEDEPVESCPPSTAYTLRKFLRKNRATIVVAASFAAILMLATGVSSWLANRAFVEADRAKTAELLAENQRRDAEQQADNAREARDAEKTLRENLEAHALRIALSAALTGDDKGTQTALEVVQQNPNRDSDAAVIRALLQIALGNFEVARTQCKEALAHDPTSFTAQALIAKTAIHTGQDGDYPAELAKLRKLTPQEEHERLALAAVEVFNEPERALEILNNMGAESRSALKLGIRAEARLHRAFQTSNIELCREALDDLERLEYIVNPNLNISGYRIIGLTYAMQVLRSQGKHAEASEFQRRAETVNTRLLRDYPELSGSPFCRWFYLFHKPDAEAAWDAISKVDRSSGSYAIFVAVDRMKNQPDARLAIEQFRTVFDDELDSYAKLAITYLQSRLRDEAATVEATADQLAHHRTVFLKKHAMYLYCLLGKADRAQQVARDVLAHHDHDHFFEVLGEKACIQAIADPVALPQLIEKASDSQVKLALARFTEAMIRLSEGDRPGAETALNKVLETRVVTFFENEYAHAFLAEMSRDKSWPRVSRFRMKDESTVDSEKKNR